MRIIVDSAYRNKSLWPRSDKYEFRLQAPIKNIQSIRLVESDIPFSSATTSQDYDRLYIRSDTGRSRSVAVAHGTYVDGLALADAFQIALDTQASDLSVIVSYVDNRLKFTSTSAFVLDDTDINAVDSMGRSVTLGVSDSIARVAGLNSGVELKATSNGTGFEAVAPHDIDGSGLDGLKAQVALEAAVQSIIHEKVVRTDDILKI